MKRAVSRGYNIGANSFMLKPLSFDEMANAMQSLCEYWFALVHLPKTLGEPARKTVRKAPISPCCSHARGAISITGFHLLGKAPL